MTLHPSATLHQTDALHQTDRRLTVEPPVGTFDSLDYVTVMIGDQILGLPIGRVHDVFITNRITLVPRAPSEIIGLLNLRGRIVTAICLRRRLGRQATLRQDREGKTELVAVGIDHQGEAYALIVDAVGEVMRLDQSTFEPTPVHLDRGWAALATGVHRLEDRLLVVLDVNAILAIELDAAA
jgi:purine-binding chemotaxis protein CheW